MRTQLLCVIFDGYVCEQPASVCHCLQSYRRGGNFEFALACVQIWNPLYPFGQLNFSYMATRKQTNIHMRIAMQFR